MRALFTASLISIWLCVGCSERVNEVQLFIPESGAGLACVDSTTGSLLIERAPRVGDGAEMSLVLDYLGLDGVPSCRASQLIEWCNTQGCPVVQRECVRLRFSPVPESSQLRRAIDAELNRVSPLTRDAPDGVVLVRAVTTAQACAELEPIGGRFPPLHCASLLGCVYSCPVQLDEVRGQVELELDTFGLCNERDVAVCSGLGRDVCL